MRTSASLSVYDQQKKKSPSFPLQEMESLIELLVRARPPYMLHVFPTLIKPSHRLTTERYVPSLADKSKLPICSVTSRVSLL